MEKKSKAFLTTAGILATAVVSLQTANAHLEPKKNENTEKCYGVAKAHKNDCASKANKHSCSGRAKIDNDPNEWIKLPKGLCEKLVSGSLEPGQEDVLSLGTAKDGHKDHNH